jgi:hypothetical protein
VYPVRLQQQQQARSAYPRIHATACGTRQQHMHLHQPTSVSSVAEYAPTLCARCICVAMHALRQACTVQHPLQWQQLLIVTST